MYIHIFPFSELLVRKGKIKGPGWNHKSTHLIMQPTRENRLMYLVLFPMVQIHGNNVCFHWLWIVRSWVLPVCQARCPADALWLIRPHHSPVGKCCFYTHFTDWEQRFRGQGNCPGSCPGGGVRFQIWAVWFWSPWSTSVVGLPGRESQIWVETTSVWGGR